MSRPTRANSVKHFPPRPGVYGSAILRLLQRDPGRCWPVNRLVDACEIPERFAWNAVARLMELQLIERRSADSVIRVCLTARGRRYRL